jgi:hypothetical protein
VERTTLSIRQFAAAVGVSHTEVGRKMRELGIAGQPQGQGKPTLLSPTDQDALSAALFVPALVNVEVLPSTDTAMMVHRPAANGLVPLHIESLTINITHANTQQLDAETARFSEVSAAGLQAIGQFMQADLTTHVQHAIAQQRHAVAGLQAQAVAGLANSLGKPKQPTESPQP